MIESKSSQKPGRGRDKLLGKVERRPRPEAPAAPAEATERSDANLKPAEALEGSIERVQKAVEAATQVGQELHKVAQTIAVIMREALMSFQEIQKEMNNAQHPEKKQNEHNILLGKPRKGASKDIKKLFLLDRKAQQTT